MSEQSGDSKLCPYCGEEIKASAIVCRFCNRPLPGHENEVPPQTNATESISNKPAQSAPNSVQTSTNPKYAPSVTSKTKIPAVPMENVGEYTQSILLPNERVLATAKIHWIIFVSPAIFIVLAIITTFIGFFSFSSANSPSDSATITMVISTLCCISSWPTGLIGFVIAFLRYKTTEFALTDKRIIGKFGIIKRRSLELVLGKIESISVNQNIWGRILDYGTLVVTGSGGTHQLFPYIAAPMELKQTINAILAE